ncbi:UxaA family hydrolase [Winogradskyella sp.]|uniref:UxaA family hydrolase n=1 Tax=Winogradskyella sp. TaxID=1883156 RepID=UPI0026262103|nr:altronate dehydratase family protein [Winogradskyella sp.]
MNTLKLHTDDNCAVALKTLSAGSIETVDSIVLEIKERIMPKHKFALKDIAKDGAIVMYGIKVGRAKTSISSGQTLSLRNVSHDTENHQNLISAIQSEKIETDTFKDLKFMGYHRKDGQVGTQNIWVVVPLVFCENRNVKIMEEAFLEELGFKRKNEYKALVRSLMNKETSEQTTLNNRYFKNIDGIKFLTHHSGCGGTREDAQMLCQLIAGYIANPNVSGATVLSLGCQNAQISLLNRALKELRPATEKPVHIFEQQQLGSEEQLLTKAITTTFRSLVEVNKIERQPAPLSKLVIGLECGGSDGFSGISANPVVGYLSDVIVSLGGSSLLAEFPELCGVEPQLKSRMKNLSDIQKFEKLMTNYANRAEAVGSGFDMNPSPGNIKDGLITDAMKSAGAAKKGGTMPIAGVLDYAEQIKVSGLHLLCTPGNDVESTTGLAGSGATIILFTTGLGTPTGNPIAPVIKISSNNELVERMPDIIDYSTGDIIIGEKTIEDCAHELLGIIIDIASGSKKSKAQQLEQDDFIPWKRGISL